MENTPRCEQEEMKRKNEKMTEVVEFNQLYIRL